MRSSTVLSVALVAAAIVPVMSAPVSSQPTQTAPAAPPYAGKVDGFLESLSPAQLQQLLTLIQAAENDGQNGGSPTPTATSNPSESNHPEKRQFGAIFGKAAGKAGAKAGKDQAKGAINSAAKRAVAPTPIVKPFPNHFYGIGPEEVHERDLSGLFDKAKSTIEGGIADLKSHLKRSEEMDARSLSGLFDEAKSTIEGGIADLKSHLKRSHRSSHPHFGTPANATVNARGLSGLFDEAKSTIEGGIADLESHLKRSDMNARDLSGLFDEAKSMIEGGITDLESHLKRSHAESRPQGARPHDARPTPVAMNARGLSGLFDEAKSAVEGGIADLESHLKRQDDLGSFIGTELGDGIAYLKSHLKRSDDLEDINERSFSGFLHDVEGTIGEIKSHLRRSIIGDVTGFVDKTKNTVEHDVSSVESDIKSHLKRSYVDEVYLD